MEFGELKQNLKHLAQQHVVSEEAFSMEFEPFRAEAFRLMFEYSIEREFKVEGYNLQKLVTDCSAHWIEICDMIFDIEETPGLADKGFRELVDYWFHDLCPEPETTD